MRDSLKDKQTSHRLCNNNDNNIKNNCETQFNQSRKKYYKLNRIETEIITNLVGVLRALYSAITIYSYKIYTVIYSIYIPKIK